MTQTGACRGLRRDSVPRTRTPEPKSEHKPPAKRYSAAKSDRAIVYSRVSQSLSNMTGCVAAGFPIVFGFTVYESFESPDVASTGVVSMPGSGESVLGGHCMVVIGYDDATQRFTIRNSWGTGWGMVGYGRTMPYAYLLNGPLASDF